MEKLIDAWVVFGYTVYWAGWILSMVIWNVHVGVGILIGIGCLVAWLIILQVFYIINGDGWLWNP